MYFFLIIGVVPVGYQFSRNRNAGSTIDKLSVLIKFPPDGLYQFAFQPLMSESLFLHVPGQQNVPSAFVSLTGENRCLNLHFSHQRYV